MTEGNGIPEGWPVRVVREDPDREGLLYAGTEFGLFVSFDDGGHWQSLQLDLPRTPITDLQVVGQDLVVATQGRSFWNAPILCSGVSWSAASPARLLMITWG